MKEGEEMSFILKLTNCYCSVSVREVSMSLHCCEVGIRVTLLTFVQEVKRAQVTVPSSGCIAQFRLPSSLYFEFEKVIETGINDLFRVLMRTSVGLWIE